MSLKWKLKRTVQCAKCPWKASVDPTEIPNGYTEEKHRALKCTIADETSIMRSLQDGEMRVMACHEDHASHCIGWLMNQLGPGNNIALRIHAMHCANLKDVKLIGEQHETFADTFPKLNP